MSAAVARPPARPRVRGPVEIVLEVSFGLLAITLSAWFVGVLIEIAGSYTLWKDEGPDHARRIVQQDLEYIAAAPRSVLVGDTVALSIQIIRWVQVPYEKLGIVRWYARTQSPDQYSVTGFKGNLSKGTASISRMLSTWAVMSMYVAMDVLLRLSIAAYALPAFVLACLMGAVDGLVRRDIRRWSGGRESSFVYHHAKRYTGWALTGGFGLYLTWPFGGFNPAYMVLVFTVLVAATLSTTVAAFKKYV